MPEEKNTIRWKDRPAFIDRAAEILNAGGDWSDVMKELPSYVTTINGQPMRFTHRQGRWIQIRVAIRQKELRR